MSDGKGKGRAIDQDVNDNLLAVDQLPSTSNSILERVTASAAGLMQSAFVAPTSNELSDATSAALTNTSKGQQLSGSGGSSWAESSSARQRTGLSTLQGHLLPSFRAGHREEHIKDAESEFSSFLDSTDPFTASQPNGLVDPFQVQATDRQVEVDNSEVDKRHNRTRPTSYSTVSEQQLHDGDAVLSILSNTSTNVDELEALQVEEEAINWNLTDRQVSQLRTIVDQIFPPAHSHISMSAEHPLNLLPAVVSTSENSLSLPTMDTNPEEAYLYFDRDVPQGAVRKMWMDQWEGVLTRYTDEVWGNVLPLVTEAREEINAMKENPPGRTFEQPKALRRLGMVLNHVRKK